MDQTVQRGRGVPRSLHRWGGRGSGGPREEKWAQASHTLESLGELAEGRSHALGLS